jgi:hypothetical protein
MKMIRTARGWCGALLIGVCGTAAADPAAVTIDIAAYEQLKSLAGLWVGRLAEEGGGDVQVRYDVMSNGKAVFEHLFPGTPHEMVTVYYLARDHLQATHYCAIGNQPAYTLATGSQPTDIRMEFAGGTGFDPQTDQHAHGVDIRVRDTSHIEVEWYFQNGTQPTGSKRMLLERTAPAAS